MKKLSPSMMCVEIDQLKDYLSIFEEEKIEYLHIDIMDGEYVPNFTLGTDYIRQLRQLTKIPLDVHLMVMHPEKKIGWFDFKEGELVSVHGESTLHLQKALQEVKCSGAKAMVALNPATPVSSLEYVLDDIDGVLIMTVNPGFAGQKAIPMAVDKIADCRTFLDEKGYPNIEIQVDGNVSYDLAGQMSKKGADIFVAGSSSFLCGISGVKEGIQKMRRIIG
ncbi:ribulose-phosphate 3-epimerase [Clostridiaceae bacterium 68-1-5]|uniref:Ribulose-phosphate 3-epimerase n=1 Tax=Suipraeoptans intestinalis TaxID=2606628 RepID=A0A6N7V221_9FIRM|nr:ribulose-phosphate 3-epimerase [Suipraeoptans intestinalis]MDY3122003.1 ribulose-phosphate 3-epimerase [Suipraeoptans intestinalis]MSR94217.1 ribulose-phosphate 3-epimerase [Suipraeoptans intestinalis]